jgi:transcriptional regulator
MPRRRPAQLSQRQVEALSLRAAGATYEQIGRALKANRGNAWRLVQRALPPLERSEHELQLELFRIDQAPMSIWPQVRQGESRQCRRSPG